MTYSLDSHKVNKNKNPAACVTESIRNYAPELISVIDVSWFPGQFLRDSGRFLMSA